MKAKKHTTNKGPDENISFQTPGMSSEQRRENLGAFGKYRQKQKATISEEEKLKLDFLQLRFEMSRFLNAQQSDYRFGFFLINYMECLQLNGKNFAEEIKIQPSELSQILHNRREPNERIMMRLEIHSNYNFPATLWFEILAKQKTLDLMKDEDLRKQEEEVVKPKVEVVI
jgi:plasmid maintenance system antidote protein VapI